ncbi:hypothetical protein niasHT_020056 [Heterodera trifolii]|uniref:Uncharacterized protein n=1 Tax=Heterodera trifolii TaxID=157864 RepID=A0ABD2LJI1_9BILA
MFCRFALSVVAVVVVVAYLMVRIPACTNVLPFRTQCGGGGGGGGVPNGANSGVAMFCRFAYSVVAVVVVVLLNQIMLALARILASGMVRPIFTGGSVWPMVVAQIITRSIAAAAVNIKPLLPPPPQPPIFVRNAQPATKPKKKYTSDESSSSEGDAGPSAPKRRLIIASDDEEEKVEIEKEK